jgi:hypothetical protein
MEENNMKASSFANKLFLGVALLLATTAFAAEKGSMKLIQPTLVGGVQLAPGEYNLSWEGTGPNLEVKVTKDGKSVATVPARAIELKDTPAANGTATKVNLEGKTAVSQVFFRGKTRALEITSDATQGQGVAASK